MCGREFKGIWIPKEIWLNTELSVMEKLFIIEIDSLNTKDKGCYASNSYFSNFFGISKGRCTQIIKKLESKGFLEIEIIKDNKLIIERQIRVVNKLNSVFRKLNRVFSKLNKGIKKTKQGYLENDEENNTVINNTVINNTNKPKRFNRFDFLKSYFLEKYNMYPEDLEEAIKSHMKVRDSKKGGKDKIAIEMYIKDLEKHTGGQIAEMIDIIKNCVYRGWIGIFPIKKEVEQKKRSKINESSYS